MTIAGIAVTHADDIAAVTLNRRDEGHSNHARHARLAVDPARANVAIMRALTSTDHAEGRAAFGEKRAPRCKGR